jgi:hypothetical protein
VRKIAHRASFYADVLILFVSLVRLACSLLLLFGQALGLGCNYSKCQMGPIRCDESHLAVAAAEFPCQIFEFPIKYLGIPLSVAKLPKVVIQSLVDQVADKLPTWKDRLMRCSGRLTLIKTTFQAIPIYVSISIHLRPWVHKALQKIFKWTGTDAVSGGRCLVAWGSVQRPLHLGGLGVLTYG